MRNIFPNGLPVSAPNRPSFAPVCVSRLNLGLTDWSQSIWSSASSADSADVELVSQHSSSSSTWGSSGSSGYWEWGRPPVQKRSHNNLFRRKNLRIGDVKQDTHIEREREREAQRVYLLLTRMQQLQEWQQKPLQKVTRSLYIMTHLGQLPFMLIT